MLKRKIFFVIASLAVLLLFTGCGDYSSIEAQLRDIEIENRLPDLPEEEIRTMEEAEDAVYVQQLAACEMLSDSYNQTHYTNFLENVNGNEKRIAEICNKKRKSIDTEIEELYKNNIYKIMENVTDCPNVDAYVTKTYANVLTFYDEYDNYLNADNTDVALTEILSYFYDRTNVLAKSFLARNEKKVFEAAVSVIEGNAQTDEDFRFYINKNNIIIKALNEIFGGVSLDYANRIEAASDKLAVNLLNSLESLTTRERGLLMDELGLSTPTPSPKPTATPKPSPSPSPTPRPTAQPTAQPTAKPAAKPSTSTAKPANSDDDQDNSATEQNPTYVLD